MNMAPKRILVVGPSGAGKSTLTRAIGAKLAIPVVHLDAINWNPGWVQSETNSFRQRLAEQIKGDAWVVDGNYSAHLDLRLPRAEVVIWLDLPRYIYFPRALWRSLRNYGRERDDVGPGNPERFDLSFFRDWVWTYKTRMGGGRAGHVKLMANLPKHITPIILRSRREVAAFERELPLSLLL